MKSEFLKMDTLKKKKTLKLDLNPVITSGHKRMDSQTGLLNNVNNTNHIESETNNEVLGSGKN